MDQDEAGSSASRDIANLVPHAKFMRLSEKDANDMLQGGKQQEFISAFWDASIYKPEFLVQVSDIMEDIMRKPTMGEPWPWPTLTKLTYGRRPGEGMYVGAGVKIGKSEFINELIAFDLQRGKKIGILKYEEKPWNTVKRVAGKIDKTFYHKPDLPYNDKDLERTALTFQGNLLMYPAFGPAVWDSTRDFIRYAALSGCKTIVVDPITKLTNHLTSSETETELRKISDELACMAQDLGFFYIVTCHLKAPLAGAVHERGGKVQSSQFRGSRSMMESCFYMLGIERNKDPELSEKERNTSTFVLLEDRNFGNSDRFDVYYDLSNQSYLEPSLGF
jgi:twinkle protein